jgi:hypothetical protein
MRGHDNVVVNPALSLLHAAGMRSVDGVPTCARSRHVTRHGALAAVCFAVGLAMLRVGPLVFSHGPCILVGAVLVVHLAGAMLSCCLML